jgi:hypothetical protein
MLLDKLCRGASLWWLSYFDFGRLARSLKFYLGLSNQTYERPT